MNIITWFTILLLLITKGLLAQSDIHFLSVDSLETYGEVEISSICYKGGKFYLPAEKKDTIFIMKVVDNTLQVEGIINLKGLNAKSEIEGSFLVDNKFFLVDEYNAQVYACNLNTGNTEKVVFNGFDRDVYKSKGKVGNEYGFEGITYNSDNNLVYLLREKNRNKESSDLLICHLTSDSGRYVLTSSNTITVDRAKDPEMRYADLFYFDSSLYLLKTTEYKYIIERIPLNDNGELGKDFPIVPILNLSGKINGVNNIFNTNLEGLVIVGDSLYVVSDSGLGSKLTLFGQIFLK